MSDVDLISGLHSVASGMDIPDVVIEAAERIGQLKADLAAAEKRTAHAYQLAADMEVEMIQLKEEAATVVEKLSAGIMRREEELAAARAEAEKLESELDDANETIEALTAENSDLGAHNERLGEAIERARTCLQDGQGISALAVLRDALDATPVPGPDRAVIDDLRQFNAIARKLVEARAEADQLRGAGAIGTTVIDRPKRT